MLAFLQSLNGQTPMTELSRVVVSLNVSEVSGLYKYMSVLVPFYSACLQMAAPSSGDFIVP